MIKILFLAANPIDTVRLNLDEEVGAIDLALRQAKFRDHFDLRPFTRWLPTAISGIYWQPRLSRFGRLVRVLLSNPVAQTPVYQMKSSPPGE